MPDFFRNIDAYCERTDSGFWSEPINAITNLAFLVAALLLYISYRKKAQPSPDIAILIALIAAIGVGSFLFHSFANLWSLLTDIIPITMFIWFYLYVFLSRALQANNKLIVLGFLSFIALNIGVGFLLQGYSLRGSQAYIPALIALVILGILVVRRNHKAAITLFSVAGIFSASLFFRSIDQNICTEMPFGTHFLWHIFNAVVLYLLTKLAMDMPARKPEES